MKNPIFGTVTTFVTAKKWSRKKKSGKGKAQLSKTKMALFFRDLENRGPFTPNSIFQTWTQKVREDMEQAGSWIRDDEEVSLYFVSKYIARLQREFWNMHMDVFEKSPYWVVTEPPTWDVARRVKLFKRIYLKVRIWGLRMKNFELRIWTPKKVALFSLVYPYGLYRNDDHACGLRYEGALFIMPYGLPSVFDDRENPFYNATTKLAQALETSPKT